MFKLLYLFIFSILSFANAYALNETLDQPPKPFLILDHFSSSDVTSLELQQINKSMLRAATRQQDYSLAMSNDNINLQDVKNKITALSVELVERKDQKGVFDISVYLKLVRNQKIIKKSSRANVLRRDMLRTVEVLANNLLGLEDIDVDTVQKKNSP